MTTETHTKPCPKPCDECRKEPATHHDTVGGQDICEPCAKDLALERMVNVGEIENVGQHQEPAPAATDASRTTSPGPPASAASTPGPRDSSPNRIPTPSPTHCLPSPTPRSSGARAA